MLKTNSIQEDKEEINLAVRLPNWIGDALMTFPMLKALEKAGIDFTCIGHPWVQDLFSGDCHLEITLFFMENFLIYQKEILTKVLKSCNNIR